MFICSKLWNTHHRPDLVRQACQKTLDDLGTPYLDLYLIHWPIAYKEGATLRPTNASGKIEYSDVDYVDTWPEMERLVDAGLVHSIGVSNFNRAQLERVLDIARIRPVINQVECHPYLAQTDLSEYCRSKSIVITAYSPLGSPQRPMAISNEANLMADPLLMRLATKHGKSSAQVLIRYQMQRGHVVIPKSVTPERIEANFNVFDFELDPSDMEQIKSLDCGGRLVRQVG